MPQTRKLSADSPVDIEEAAEVLRRGGAVAFPTETVYGLGANALNEAAVARVFEAKLRPSWDPLIVHVPELSAALSLVELDGETERRVHALAEKFWPGPLTLLLPRKSLIPDAVTAGRPLVGIRVPAHNVALALLHAAGVPIAAPSANTFGHVSPTTAAHVLADLDGRIDAVLDGGSTAVGLESTVIDPTQTPIALYRPGAVTANAIKEVCRAEVLVVSGSRSEREVPEALPSPGFGLRHYAPNAQVILVDGRQKSLLNALKDLSADTGVLLPTGWPAPENVMKQPWADWNNPDALAANLFLGLRALEQGGVAQIVCPLPPPGGLNDAIRDRLLKAAKSV